jgi:phosphatidate cytidylyltransferase
MTSIFCQLGDLLFSYLKRRAKQKDTGNIFPGHGGVLDRLDGIFLGLPCGFITMLLIT